MCIGTKVTVHPVQNIIHFSTVVIAYLNNDIGRFAYDYNDIILYNRN